VRSGVAANSTDRCRCTLDERDGIAMLLQQDQAFSQIRPSETDASDTVRL